jgi:hypothetical protein
MPTSVGGRILASATYTVNVTTQNPMCESNPVYLHSTSSNFEHLTPKSCDPVSDVILHLFPTAFLTQTLQLRWGDTMWVGPTK